MSQDDQSTGSVRGDGGRAAGEVGEVVGLGTSAEAPSELDDDDTRKRTARGQQFDSIDMSTFE